MLSADWCTKIDFLIKVLTGNFSDQWLRCFFGCEVMNLCQARFIEFPHGLFVYYASSVKVRDCFVDCCKCITLVGLVLSHRILPLVNKARLIIQPPLCIKLR